MELYPLKFEPILKRVLWGGVRIAAFKQMSCTHADIGESWELSQVADSVSVVSNGYLKGKSLTEIIDEFGERLLGKTVVNRVGREFPLLFKFIDAEADLSIQVHPDDVLAKERHHRFGKTEMWYVVEAQPGSRLISGFNQPISGVDFDKLVCAGTMETALKVHYPKPGDVFYIPAGRVHALGAGLLIAEIQQSSDVTYRIFDYNRVDALGQPRELHTELAKQAIDFEYQETTSIPYDSTIDGAVSLISTGHFVSNRLYMKASDVKGEDEALELERDYSTLDSFVVLMCVEGEGQLYCDDHTFSLKQGDTMLIPAEMEGLLLSTSSKLVILETYL